MSEWAVLKGLGLLGTGDFTHPLWFKQLRKKLKECGRGAYEFRGTKFILSAEVSCVFKKGGRARKVHVLLLAPGLRAADRINGSLKKYGRIDADGRPTLKISCASLAEAVLEKEENTLIIPSHVWTPHFGALGSKSGFDTLEECFENKLKHIHAVETGLSSDPGMNRRVPFLDGFSLVSNSDAHSPQALGREANVFEIRDPKNVFYEIAEILKERDSKKFLFTVEHFSETGKYYHDGHRQCGFSRAPGGNGACPVCGRKLTEGVLSRIEKSSGGRKGPPARVPEFKGTAGLEQVIAIARGVSVKSEAVRREYLDAVSAAGSEFRILLDCAPEDLRGTLEPKTAEALMKIKTKKFGFTCGYDGKYGGLNLC